MKKTLLLLRNDGNRISEHAISVLNWYEYLGAGIWHDDAHIKAMISSKSPFKRIKEMGEEILEWSHNTLLCLAFTNNPFYDPETDNIRFNAEEIMAESINIIQKLEWAQLSTEIQISYMAYNLELSKSHQNEPIETLNKLYFQMRGTIEKLKRFRMVATTTQIETQNKGTAACQCMST